MAHVLIIDDEPEVCEYLSSILREEGFESSSLPSGESLESKINARKPDLVLLDYRLPGANGAQIIQKMRALNSARRIPVIMVTGIDSEDQKVEALNLGADDYVLKPFSPRELTARMRAVLRRTRETNEAPEIIETEGLTMDFGTHKVLLQGEEVYLTLTEFKILSELLKHKGRVLSRDQLRQTALGNLNVTDRTIDVHMASLRKKLASVAEKIETVRGVGYRFNISISSEASNSSNSSEISDPAG